MRHGNARKGSALLIVLGMMAFMVISAVSFAIYMRESRKPSSYLRRAASSRYLLKAALANAIGSIDGRLDMSTGLVEGIYDDPYPGVGPSQNDAGNNNDRNGDFWDHRVFTPFGPASEEFTVSTLTLEALAYLPPAIINEVRLYSRKTRTAEWHNLAFDTGRYAFCAVDVSDCFDINKVRANERRTSAPGQRVNLSPLYEANAETVDKTLSKADSFEIPFISLADFNIVAGVGNPLAPFMRYIGSSGSQLYSKSDYQTVSNALFITDTWFPPTNRTAQIQTFNLEGNAQDQPFLEGAYTETADILSIDENKTRLSQMLMKNIGGIGLMCLFDYLDADSRPISFSIPTVETVPMVTGIGLVHGGGFPLKFGEMDVKSGLFDSGIPDPDKGNKKNKMYFRKATKYGLTTLNKDGFLLTGTTAYPFKRTGVKGYDKNFTGEVLIKLFFGPSAMPCRLDVDSPLYPGKDWTDSVKDGVVTVKAAIDKIEISDNCQVQADAVRTWRATVNNVPAVKMPAFWYVQCFAGENDKAPAISAGDDAPYYSLEAIRDDAQAMKPYAKDAQGGGVGKIASWWKDAPVGENTVASWPSGGVWPKEFKRNKVTLGSDKYSLHMLVWVRIIDGNGKTVDVVPARLTDDIYWGERAMNVGDAIDLAGQFKFLGSGTPVLEFRGNLDFTYSCGGADSADVKLKGDAVEEFNNWNCLYAPDPRFNFAPENWIPKNGGNGNATEAEWLSIVNNMVGKAGRDPDIFMFTSDQQRLQSIGELAFIPALEYMDGSAKFFEGAYKETVTARMNGSDMASRLQNGATDTAAIEFMWKTYSPFIDNLYSLTDDGVPCEVVSGTRCFRANPLSQDPRVWSAVIRNTPFDYFVASTNDQCGLPKDLSVAESLKYCFHRTSSAAKMSDRELDGIAGGLRRTIAVSARSANPYWDWTQPFNDHSLWFDGQSGDGQVNFCGTSLDAPLHGVDRKFLYSFWRECFQNRQQLFLVFIRAEPLTVGGMGIGSLAAAQLGARGVALVWRDPMPPAKGRTERRARNQLSGITNWRNQSEQSGPHRTRVLFYHQFD